LQTCRQSSFSHYRPSLPWDTLLVTSPALYWASGTLTGGCLQETCHLGWVCCSNTLSANVPVSSPPCKNPTVPTPEALVVPENTSTCYLSHSPVAQHSAQFFSHPSAFCPPKFLFTFSHHLFFCFLKDLYTFIIYLFRRDLTM
jgi:hypothetical protein